MSDYKVSCTVHELQVPAVVGALAKLGTVIVEQVAAVAAVKPPLKRKPKGRAVTPKPKRKEWPSAKKFYSPLGPDLQPLGPQAERFLRIAAGTDLDAPFTSQAYQAGFSEAGLNIKSATSLLSRFNKIHAVNRTGQGTYEWTEKGKEAIHRLMAAEANGSAAA